MEITTMSTHLLNVTGELVAEAFVNATNVTHAAAPCDTPKGKIFGVIVKVVYAIGIVGNAAAIVALRRGERRVRNRKHLLLLTSLAANDLVALVSFDISILT